MKKILNYAAALACLLLIVSCEENERMPYSSEPRVYFFEQILLPGGLYEDVFEKTYTFADKSSDVTEDTVYIKTRIMGYAADHDRNFKAVVVSDSSAVAEYEGVTYYKVLDGYVKAGEVEGYLPLLVYRTSLIKDSTLQITLHIVDADGYDLEAGVRENLNFNVSWGDKLVKPANWDTDLAYFFGTYSDTKYQFVIDVLGISTFTIYARYNPTGQYTTAAMYDFAARLKDALKIYNAANDPDLTDENGQLVTFP
jgi:hypothetical protein